MDPIKETVILGIETSCDETAVALISDKRGVLSHMLISQEIHKEYGGVVPELSSREHLKYLDPLIEKALEKSGLSYQDLTAVAATIGPGLIGGLIIGAMTGRALVASLKIPFIPINHLEAHALIPKLTNDIPFPYLLLLVSGGHCQFVIVEDIGKYHQIGTTIDDAIGEAFDKIGKMIGLDYPCGPLIEKLSQDGNANAYTLPKPLIDKGRKDTNFSFSGLKTAAKDIITAHLKTHQTLSENFKQDLCASLLKTICDILEDRTKHAFEIYKQTHPNAVKSFVISGGVAANKIIGKRLTELSHRHQINFYAPPIEYCTDNGIMIAFAGLERIKADKILDPDTPPQPRWPLAECS